MRLFSIVVEQMVLQNSISTNDFSHSVQGWSFSPVCISKCLPKVLELLNDFLHSVVQLCGFSPLSMNMCSFNFPVCVNDFFHSAQCEWPYECSDFELGWITFCILCTCLVYIGQLGLRAQGFGKMEPKWQFMGQKWEDSFCPICGWCASMRIGRYIHMAKPSCHHQLNK